MARVTSDHGIVECNCTRWPKSPRIVGSMSQAGRSLRRWISTTRPACRSDNTALYCPLSALHYPKSTSYYPLSAFYCPFTALHCRFTVFLCLVLFSHCGSLPCHVLSRSFSASLPSHRLHLPFALSSHRISLAFHHGCRGFAT